MRSTTTWRKREFDARYIALSPSGVSKDVTLILLGHSFSDLVHVNVSAHHAEWSKALDSGSREPGSIRASAILVGFSRPAHAVKYTHGQ